MFDYFTAVVLSMLSGVISAYLVIIWFTNTEDWR